ncbi:MAG: hypothetical protein AAF264_13630 [Pseudomonadota bacterium]
MILVHLLCGLLFGLVCAATMLIGGGSILSAPLQELTRFKGARTGHLCPI